MCTAHWRSRTSETFVWWTRRPFSEQQQQQQSHFPIKLCFSSLIIKHIKREPSTQKSLSTWNMTTVALFSFPKYATTFTSQLEDEQQQQQQNTFYYWTRFCRVFAAIRGTPFHFLFSLVDSIGTAHAKFCSNISFMTTCRVVFAAFASRISLEEFFGESS